uniref:Uncharacterized protein n=1 Tax=Oryza brachyantha TaxID=4533 RepID=J3N1D4_ORYBR
MEIKFKEPLLDAATTNQQPTNKSKKNCHRGIASRKALATCVSGGERQRAMASAARPCLASGGGASASGASNDGAEGEDVSGAELGER